MANGQRLITVDALIAGGKRGHDAGIEESSTPEKQIGAKAPLAFLVGLRRG